MPDSDVTVNASFERAHWTSGDCTVTYDPDTNTMTVTGIGEFAFEVFSALTNLSIANTVTSIGEFAFYNCSSLKDITIPASVTNIGSAAFHVISQDATVTFLRPSTPGTLTTGDTAILPFATLAYSGDNKYYLYDGDNVIEANASCNALNARTLTWKLPPFADGVGARLAGNTISLDGSIGVNFYMELTPEIAASQTAYMQFTIPNGDKTETKTILVNEADQKDGYYVFKCNVAAKDMSSKVQAQLIDGSDHSILYTYSVKEYADYLLSHTDVNALYTKAAPLVMAMLQYGAYAKEYFDKTNTLPDLTDVDIDSQFAAYTSTLTEDIFSGATLSLKSQTTLSLYFTSADELTFTCVDKDGKERVVDTEKNGSDQVARIRNIAASELQNSFTVTVKNGETEIGTITYSPMNYCYKAINGGTENGKLINAVKALYQYSQAANEFFSINRTDQKYQRKTAAFAFIAEAAAV